MNHAGPRMTDLQKRITPWLALALGANLAYAAMDVRPIGYVVPLVLAGVAGFHVLKDSVAGG